MPHFHSIISLGGSQARVTRGNPDNTPGEVIAHVVKRDGFWEASQAGTGKLLLPRVPHTEIVKGEKKELPLGVVLKALREALMTPKAA